MKRPYHYFCFFVLVSIAGLGVLWQHADNRSERWYKTVTENRQLGSILGLSDLVLSTEGRYLRHPSMSDFFSAFQDSPSGFDLFPSGAFIKPPYSTLTQQAENP